VSGYLLSLHEGIWTVENRDEVSLEIEHQGCQASNLHLAVCFDSTSCLPSYSASYTYLLRAR
jgi:hypothetical protein